MKSKKTSPVKQLSGKVAFNLMHSTVRGGIEEMFVHYTQLLINLGYTVYCIVPNGYQYEQDLACMSPHAKVIYLPIHGYYDVIALLRFNRLISKYQPELLISHKGRNHSLLKFWQIIRRVNHRYRLIKTIAVCHGCTKRLNHFDAVITVSRYLRPLLRQRQYAGKLFHLPNFLSAPSSQKTKKERVEKCHIHKKVTFGLMGRLSPEKGFSVALEAFSLLSNEQPTLDFSVVIAGDGAEKTHLEQQVQLLDLQQKVTFVGWINNKAEYFHSIDVIVVPSLHESFGLIVLEAFRYSKAVIASRIEGPSEIITDHINGLLFESNNPQSCYQAISKLVSDEALYHRLCDNGHRSLITTYSETEAQKRLSKILQQLVVSPN